MGRATKRPVVIGQYTKAHPDGWKGWVEDKSKSWILFFKENGEALFYPQRDEEGGVVGTKRYPSLGLKKAAPKTGKKANK